MCPRLTAAMILSGSAVHVKGFGWRWSGDGFGLHELDGAGRYERNEARQDTRAGSYERTLQTSAGEVNLKVPKLRRQTFETAIIDRYRRRESSVEEALIEMYLAGISVRRVEDITEALWGTRVSPSTVSNLNKKIYAKIEAWRNRRIEGEHPYLYLDGIVMKRTWAGEVRNVSLLVASAVNSEGFREFLGICEGAKEDKSGWSAFLRHLVDRGLNGVQLIISDACRGLMESAAEYLPDARWQRCMVHFYRNIFSHVPATKVREVSYMLKAIHSQENRNAADRKARAIVEGLRAGRMNTAADLVERSVHETLTYYAFPDIHWHKIRTNNPLERIMREIRRRTRCCRCIPRWPVVPQPRRGTIALHRGDRSRAGCRQTAIASAQAAEIENHDVNPGFIKQIAGCLQTSTGRFARSCRQPTHHSGIGTTLLWTTSLGSLGFIS